VAPPARRSPLNVEAEAQHATPPFIKSSSKKLKGFAKQRLFSYFLISINLSTKHKYWFK
jgi:hypothetical protein